MILDNFLVVSAFLVDGICSITTSVGDLSYMRVVVAKHIFFILSSTLFSLCKSITPLSEYLPLINNAHPVLLDDVSRANTFLFFLLAILITVEEGGAECSAILYPLYNNCPLANKQNEFISKVTIISTRPSSITYINLLFHHAKRQTQTYSQPC